MKLCKSRVCKAVFEPKHNNEQYCCRVCANAENYAMKKDKGFKQYVKKPLVKKVCQLKECSKEFKTHRDNKIFCCKNCGKRDAYLRNQKVEGSYAYKKKVKPVKCSNDNCDNDIEKDSLKRKYCSVKCSKEQNFRNQSVKLKTEVSGYNKTKTKAKQEHGNAKEIFIPSEFLKPGRIAKKERKIENKHFSAQWMEDLWNERKEMMS